jgi:hypothetical protein
MQPLSDFDAGYGRGNLRTSKGDGMEKKEGGPFGEWSLVPMNFLWWILLKIPCAEGSLARSTTGGVVSSMGLKNIALKDL